MTELTRRTSGASEIPSSASRSSASSCVVEALLGLLEDGAGAERLRGARHALELDEDVVARGHAEVERVTRREPELVEPVQVPRVGERDPEHLALDRVRDRDHALQHVQRDLRRRVLVDPGEREIDVRHLVAERQRARHALRRCDSFVDDRLRERAAARTAADERELVGRHEARCGEEVDDELGGLVDRERRAEALAAGRGGRLLAGRADGAQAGRTLVVHIPRSSYRQAGLFP